MRFAALLWIWGCHGFFSSSTEEASKNILNRAECQDNKLLLRNSRILFYGSGGCPIKYPWKYNGMCCKYSVDKILEESAVGEWMRKNGEFKYLY